MEQAEESLEEYINQVDTVRYLEENEIWQIFIEVSLNYTLKLEPEINQAFAGSDLGTAQRVIASEWLMVNTLTRR